LSARVHFTETHHPLSKPKSVMPKGSFSLHQWRPEFSMDVNLPGIFVCLLTNQIASVIMDVRIGTPAVPISKIEVWREFNYKNLSKEVRL